MIIVYACYSGIHAAVLAGALHLGWITSFSLSGWHSFKRLSYFDSSEGRSGLRYLGRTDKGNLIYTAAVGNDGGTAEKAVKSLLTILNRNPNDLLWVDVSREVSLLWRLGGCIKRSRLLEFLGRFLLQIGIWWDYPRIVKLVKNVYNQYEGSWDSKITAKT
ncbi:MAG: hypothetical protein PWP31_215 [Clostridia bacterium]|nr:hypothetical protein [Clostridia bacterium]